MLCFPFSTHSTPQIETSSTERNAAAHFSCSFFPLEMLNRHVRAYKHNCGEDSHPHCASQTLKPSEQQTPNCRLKILQHMGHRPPLHLLCPLQDRQTPVEQFVLCVFPPFAGFELRRLSMPKHATTTLATHQHPHQQSAYTVDILTICIFGPQNNPCGFATVAKPAAKQAVWQFVAPRRARRRKTREKERPRGLPFGGQGPTQAPSNAPNTS